MSALPSWAAAWLDAVGELGWRGVAADEVAQRSGLAPATLLHGGDRHDALAELAAHADRAMREGAQAEGDPRERLFDLAMARFDALAPWRAAIRAVVAARDPGALVALAAGAPASLRRMGEAADLDMGGLAGPWRGAALGAVLARASHVWLADDSADMAATMAELDRRLDEARRFLGINAPWGRSESAPGPTPEG